MKRIFTFQDQVQHGTSPLGISAPVNPRGNRAPSTCDRQASQTHSWGSCIYDSRFLCHFTVTWETRGAGSLGAPSFRRGQNERECGRTQWRGGASVLNCPAPDIFFREEKKRLENCKYTGQRWNRAQDIGLGSGQAILCVTRERYALGSCQ